jgi:DNA-binding CsgD family transcriptional regulator
VDRALAAAGANLYIGAFDEALSLLGVAAAGPLDELQRARVEVLRAQHAFVSSRGGDAPRLLLSAAKCLEPLDVELARETYLDALSAVMFAGRLASPGGGSLDVSAAACAAPRPSHPPRAPDLLLDGLAALFSDGYAAGVPTLRRALSAFGNDMSTAEELRWLWLACVAALHLWDDDRWELLSSRHVQLAHEAGALSELPLALSSRIFMDLFAGDLVSAASLVEQIQAATEATGSSLSSYGALGLSALRGRESDAVGLFEATSKDVLQRGEGIGISVIGWSNAVLYNGLARFEVALSAARQVTEHPLDLGTSNWGMVELIEAAVRCGTPELAAATHRRLREMTRVSGTDWALGIEARCGALLVEGAAAEHLYREAIERLGRTRLRAERARAHLLYGEWLRRENRRIDARAQLHTADALLTEIGMEAFAERARIELAATGEKVRKRSVETRDELTAQELQVARMALDGLSNPDIAARLFISPRTVKYHLRKVFAKLDISSRAELDRVLPRERVGAETV